MPLGSLGVRIQILPQKIYLQFTLPSFFFGRFFEAFRHNLFGARRTYPGEISQPRPSLCQMDLYEGATDEFPTPLALVTP